MPVFVSYARGDQVAVEGIVQALEMAGFDVWLDRELLGGTEWWPEILRQIRGADGFVVAVSRAAMSSDACAAERQYALRLGKPLIPLLVEPIDPRDLPHEIRSRQIVDYTVPGERAIARIFGALRKLPPAPPLPRVLPPEPAAPSGAVLESRAHADSLTREEQLAIVREVEQNQSDRTSARAILNSLLNRDDLYAVVEREARRLFDRLADSGRSGDSGGPGGSGRSGGSGREAGSGRSYGSSDAPAVPDPRPAPYAALRPSVRRPDPADVSGYEGAVSGYEGAASGYEGAASGSGATAPGYGEAALGYGEAALGSDAGAGPHPDAAAAYSGLYPNFTVPHRPAAWDPPVDAAPVSPNMTPADVRNTAFRKPPLGTRGYAELEVDGFLDRVEEELALRIALLNGSDDGRRPGLTAAGVGSAAFGKPPLGKRGYLVDDVDEFLDEVQREFARLDELLGRRGFFPKPN
ncbi:TIR domain-containing protein [Cryptosporangium sp. NPDC051539]|uniref:TIR domain-containing protein n=1 Tax=Cryptosporangium sp. NPDC051539 TaxID=3363962 RepID=UPI0037AB11BD